MLGAMVALTGGGDVTPAAVDWANISTPNTPNAAQTISELSPGRSIRLSVIRTSGTTGYEGRWVKNGSPVGAGASIDSAIEVSVRNDDQLAFEITAASVGSATQTVTNVTDGGAVLDTFTATFI